MLAVPCACLVVASVALSACGGSQTQADSPGSTCQPGRCLDDIAAVIEPQRPAARACYDAKPGLAGGTIIMNFEIDPAGAVVEASQSMKDGQLEDAEVVDCLGNILKGLTFAPSPAGKTTRAYHAFEFTGRRGSRAP